MFLIIINRVINLIIKIKARIKVLLLSVLNNFNNSFISAHEINILEIKDYALIEILILIIYYINNIKLKLIDLLKISRFFLRIFFFKNNIKEIFKALL